MKIVITLTEDQARKIAEEYRTTESYHGEPLNKDNFLWYEFLQFRCLNMLSRFEPMTEAERDDWACKASEINAFLKLYRGD